MADIVLRNTKGTSLTWNEMDQNLTNLNNAKLEQETDPVFTASPAFGITAPNITSWNTAASSIFSGDYNDLLNKPVLFDGDYNSLINKPSIPNAVSQLTNDSGYLTSFTETDPVFTASAASGITALDITSWNNKSTFSGSYNDLTGKPSLFDGNYNSLTNKPSIPTATSQLTNDAGFITGYTETDPVFTASPANGITSPDITSWNNAYSWGNHASASYIKNIVEDTTPELGGNLDVLGNTITSSTSIINTDKDVKVPGIQFNTVSPSASTLPGQVVWNAVDDTLEFKTSSGVNTVKIGKEEILKIHNGTGSALTKGQVVYITGSTGTLPSIALASSSSEITSSNTIGVVNEPIANGDDGYIKITGIVDGLDTLAFTAGDKIWLSSTAGEFTGTQSTFPNHLVFIGWVVKTAGGNGSIFVNIQNGYELDELHNVVITTPVTDNVLKYDGAKWVNGIVTGGGGTPAGSNGNIQFNNAGAFGANSGLTWNNTTNNFTVNGGVTVGGLNITNTPSVGNTNIGVTYSANFPLFSIFDELGKRTLLQSHLSSGKISVLQAPSAIAAEPSAPSFLGAAFLKIGTTIAPNFAYASTFNYADSLKRYRNYSNLGTANNSNGWYQGSSDIGTIFPGNSNDYGINGFYYSIIFSFTKSGTFAITGKRGYIGLRTNNISSIPTNVEPTTLANIFCLAILSTSSNLHFCCLGTNPTNNTVVDLGVNFPSDPTGTVGYKFSMYSPKASNRTVYWQVERLGTSYIASGSVINAPTDGFPSVSNTAYKQVLYQTNNTFVLTSSDNYGIELCNIYTEQLG